MGFRSAVVLIFVACASIAWLPWPGSRPNQEKESQPTSPARAPVDRATELAGLWERTDLPEADDVRFYFFHPSGIGLYRFGKLGLNHTHMFRYVQAGSKLALVFSRSGEHHELTVTRQQRGDATFLTLSEDPREDGHSMTYRRRSMPNDAAGLAADAEPNGFNRMWIHVVRSQKGADAFAMYQFQKPNAAGRGHGWFHHGDYDEWTTESLDYEKRGKKLALNFELTKQSTQTKFEVRRSPDGRILELERDPRGFWQKRRFLDQGPSFAMAHSMFLDVGLR